MRASRSNGLGVRYSGRLRVKVLIVYKGLYCLNYFNSIFTPEFVLSQRPELVLCSTLSDGVRAVEENRFDGVFMDENYINMGGEGFMDLLRAPGNLNNGAFSSIVSDNVEFYSGLERLFR